EIAELAIGHPEPDARNPSAGTWNHLGHQADVIGLAVGVGGHRHGHPLCRQVGHQDLASDHLARFAPQRPEAWFKNAGFRVTLGTSAQTLIGPALERVFASSWLPCWDFSSARTACTPEAPASEHAAHPSATRQDSCRLDWGLHCAGTGGGSRRTEAASSSPCPTAAAGRSSCAAGC